MLKFILCILIVAGVYFMCVGFLHTADEVRGIGESHPTSARR